MYSNFDINHSETMIYKRYAVFIPCYNAAATIGETISSVKAAIAFTGIQIPVFIYDDCSKDNSYELISGMLGKKFHDFNLLRNKENSGERTTTNRAFKQLEKEVDWVFIIHADDIVKKEWLSILINEIEQVNDKSCFTVWSSYDTFSNLSNVQKGDNSGLVTHIIKDKKTISDYIRKISSSWHISGAALNVHLYLALNGFAEDMPQYGDTDFFIRGLLAGYTDLYIARTLTLYRVSANSVTGTSFSTSRDIREIHILIDRFGYLLSSQEVAGIYRLIAGMCGRRMIKAMLRIKFKPAIASSKQFVLATYNYLRFNLGYS